MPLELHLAETDRRVSECTMTTVMGSRIHQLLCLLALRCEACGGASGHVQQGGIPMDGLHNRLCHLCGDRQRVGAKRGWCGLGASVGMMKAMPVPGGASSVPLSRQGSARAFLVNTLPSTYRRCSCVSLPFHHPAANTLLCQFLFRHCTAARNVGHHQDRSAFAGGYVCLDIHPRIAYISPC